MGLSNGASGGGDAPAASGAAPAMPHKDLGDRLGGYFQSRYPLAGGLADMVFGHNQNPDEASRPSPQMPGQPESDYSMLSMNSQPRQGGGLATLLKLLA